MKRRWGREYLSECACVGYAREREEWKWNWNFMFLAFQFANWTIGSKTFQVLVVRSKILPNSLEVVVHPPPNSVSFPIFFSIFQCYKQSLVHLRERKKSPETEQEPDRQKRGEREIHIFSKSANEIPSILLPFFHHHIYFIFSQLYFPKVYN